jgi:hypothetical protein
MHLLTTMVSVLLLAVANLGQPLPHRITNQDVIDMVSLGLSHEVIVDKIHATDATDFDTDVSGLKALKLGNVSDAVIAVSCCIIRVYRGLSYAKITSSYTHVDISAYYADNRAWIQFSARPSRRT